MYQAIVFDFDGVITNGIPLHDKAYLKIFKKYGIVVALDHLHTKIGLTIKEVISQIFDEFAIKENVDKVVKNHANILFEQYEKRASIPDELIEFLNSCKKYRLKIAVASSTHSKILRMVLQKFKIEEYFEVVIGGENISKGKPNPEMIEKALKELHVNAINAIAIDDAQSGIVAAKKIEMFSIAYTRYSQKVIPEADINVTSFKEINLNQIARALN